MLYSNHAINSDYSKLTNKQLQVLWAETIGKPLRTRYLLSQSVKVLKGEKFGYLTGVLYMSNATKIGGINTCSHAKIAGCIEPCLAMSGHMAGQSAIEARLDRLHLLIKNAALFFEILSREIRSLYARALRKGYRAVVRLNGTTDLDWTKITFNQKTIFAHHALIRFYDYTKNPSIARNYRNHGIHTTFSWYSKAPIAELHGLLDRGVNIAIAYRDKVPADQVIGDRTVRVINGDEHDLRFLDDSGVVVGLKYKNQTMHDRAKIVNAIAHKSGFLLFAGSAIKQERQIVNGQFIGEL